MFFEVLPLRAVVFQSLFLLIAIALEAPIFRRTLDLDYKASMQSAISVNLLSTFIGWICFFISQPFLPIEWRVQLISLIFFEHFYTDQFLPSVASVLVVFTLGMFLGTFLIKLQGLELLDLLLDRKQESTSAIVEKPIRFRNKQKQLIGKSSNSRVYAVLVANAASFSAILLLLFLRLAGQIYFPH